MAHELTKLLPILVYPLGLAILLLLAAALLARRRLGSALILIAISVLWIGATDVFADWLLRPLESDYLPTAIAEIPSADAIVVLGGGTAELLASGDALDLGPASGRVFHAAQLYLAGKAPRIVVAGGARENKTPEAVAMAQLLAAFGVPEAAILQENQSRNTWQNALNSKAILHKHSVDRVLLVTSAFHIRRALAAFRAAGIEATPAPTDYRGLEQDHTIVDWFPEAGALYKTTYAIKEYLGLIVYRWRGWAT